MPRKLRAKLQPIYFVDVRFSDVGWLTVASSVIETPMQKEFDEWDLERRVREHFASAHPHSQRIDGVCLKRVEGVLSFKVLRSWSRSRGEGMK